MKEKSVLERSAFNVEEVAHSLGISVSGVFRLMRTGQIKRSKILGKTVVLRADLDDFLRRTAEAA